MICEDCHSKKVEHILCKKCTQTIINNVNGLGRKQGAVEELERLRKFNYEENSDLQEYYLIDEYCKKRLKKLEEGEKK